MRTEGRGGSAGGAGRFLEGSGVTWRMDAPGSVTASCLSSNIIFFTRRYS